MFQIFYQSLLRIPVFIQWLIYIYLLLQNHLETCEGFLIACPNKCGTRIASEMVKTSILLF